MLDWLLVLDLMLVCVYVKDQHCLICENASVIVAAMTSLCAMNLGDDDGDDDDDSCYFGGEPPHEDSGAGAIIKYIIFKCRLVVCNGDDAVKPGRIDNIKEIGCHSVNSLGSESAGVPAAKLVEV